jgi:hypothetical protein
MIEEAWTGFAQSSSRVSSVFHGGSIERYVYARTHQACQLHDAGSARIGILFYLLLPKRSRVILSASESAILD